MGREELRAERDRVLAKLKASTARDGSVRPGAGERVAAIRARLAEIDELLREPD